MIRDDGSVRSAHFPAWDNKYQIRDHGLYRGIVRDVLYVDDEDNDSADVSDEVVYNVMIIGGDRDGQIFNNARLMRGLGGFSNFEEITLKATEGVTGFDLAQVEAQADVSLNNIDTLNGDVVYLQFLNGDPHLPVIVGLGKHQSADSEATEDEGPRYSHSYNGITTEITKDGEFTWSKNNGAYVPIAPNPDNLLAPFINQFAPLPGDQGLTVTLGNEFDFSFEYSTGLSVSIDGISDNFEFSTAAGAVYTLDGIADSHELSTTVGTSFKISGIEDSLELSASAGASIKIDGISDEISITSAFGDSVTISALEGIQASTPSGTSLSMTEGEITLTSGAQANLVLGSDGFVKLGNATGDALLILQELIESLSGAVYSGFGAPGSNVGDLVQLLVKIQLITGG